LAAPGENILSTVRNSGQARKSGTSMSAPAVAAQAGRIYRQGRGEVTFQDVRDCILASALQTEGLNSSIQEGRILAPGLGSCEIVGTNNVNTGTLDLILSPNPAAGLTVLEIGTTLNTPGKVTIFNVGGQQIRETRFSRLPENGKVNLNLRGIPPGLYLLTVSAAEHTGVTKLIIAGD
jgi:subtilisin family serine protease